MRRALGAAGAFFAPAVRAGKAALRGACILAFLAAFGAALRAADTIAPAPRALWAAYYLAWAAAACALFAVPLARFLLEPARPAPGIPGAGDYADEDGMLAALNALTPGEYLRAARRNAAALGLSGAQTALVAGGSGAEARKTLALFIAERRREARGIIAGAAKNVFVITSLSQNGTADFLATAAITARMLEDITARLGRGLGRRQKLRLYAGVISASFLAARADTVVAGLNIIKIKPLNMILSSAINGAMNAFICLAAGHTAVRWLETGSMEGAAEQARARAGGEIYGVVREGITDTRERFKIDLETFLAGMFPERERTEPH